MSLPSGPTTMTSFSLDEHPRGDGYGVGRVALGVIFRAVERVTHDAAVCLIWAAAVRHLLAFDRRKRSVR